MGAMKNKRDWKTKAKAGSGLALMASLLIPAPVLASDTAPPALQLARQLNEAFVGAAEKVSTSVVVIEVVQRPGFGQAAEDHPFFDQLSPEDRRRLEEFYKKRLEEESQRPPRFGGTGSGIIIRENGYILTNAHVVDGAEKIRVRLQTGREFPSTGVWTDPQSDIAVIKIDAEDLPVARLGDSSKVRVGEFAIAIGAPQDLEYSVTVGHVSAKGRTQIIPSMGRNSLGASMDQDFIQTDASINPGNSGGPLVNIEGDVIGINTLVRDSRTRIGFAIPVNLARSVADELIEHGKYVRPWLGIAVEPLRASEKRKRVAGIEHGLVVSEVNSDGPAMGSGLKADDIITAVDGTTVATVQQLRSATRAKKAGAELTLDIVRDGESMQLKVRSAPWPDIFGAVSSTRPPQILEDGGD